jgi:hypothetical protein
MSNLSTDAIVTIISTIPGLLVSSLSAWFAYAALRRRHVARNDIETSTIELVLMRIDAASLMCEHCISYISGKRILVSLLTFNASERHLLLLNFHLFQWHGLN